VAILGRRKKHSPDPAVEEARRLLEQAEQELAAAKEDEGRVEELARRLHEIRLRNRFATMMRQAMEGER
jgi:hypothetical protein